MPPRWMWLFDDELDEWLDRVREKRRSPGGDDATPMARNELADRLRGR